MGRETVRQLRSGSEGFSFVRPSFTIARRTCIPPPVSVPLPMLVIVLMVDMFPPITRTSLLASRSRRLVNSKAPPVTLYGTDVFDKGIAWGPKLTFANRRCAARRRPPPPAAASAA
jgi:hypothetical protein